MVYLGLGDKTVLRFVEVKALREIKLSLEVAGKQKVSFIFILEFLFSTVLFYYCNFLILHIKLVAKEIKYLLIKKIY